MNKEAIVDLLWSYPKKAAGYRWDIDKAIKLYDAILPYIGVPKGLTLNCVCGESIPLDPAFDSYRTYSEGALDRREGERREPFGYFRGTVIDDYFPDEPRRVYNRPGKDIGWIYDRRRKDRRTS